jgi:hypothetical protein
VYVGRDDGGKMGNNEEEITGSMNSSHKIKITLAESPSNEGVGQKSEVMRELF